MFLPGYEDPGADATDTVQQPPATSAARPEVRPAHTRHKDVASLVTQPPKQLNHCHDPTTYRTLR